MESQSKFGTCGTTESTEPGKGTDVPILVFDPVTGSTCICSTPGISYMLTPLKHTSLQSLRKTVLVAEGKVTHVSVLLMGNVVRQPVSVAEKVLTAAKAGKFAPIRAVVDSELC